MAHEDLIDVDPKDVNPADATPPQEGDTPPPGGDLLDGTPPDDDKKAPEGDLLSDDENDPPEGVPDQYTFEPPEDLEITEVMQEGLDRFGETARDLGLSQDQYQKLIEYDLERSQAAATEVVDEWNARVDGWKDAARADKEIGGQHFAENVQYAKAALSKFGTAELAQFLQSPSETNPEGLAISNHPEVIRLLAKVGRALGDPDILEGDSKVEDTGGLQRMYPSMFPKTE